MATELELFLKLKGKSYSGTLYNWQIRKNNKNKEYLAGYVYDSDVFTDDSLITTSEVLTIYKEENIAETLNSHYKLDNSTRGMYNLNLNE